MMSSSTRQIIVCKIRGIPYVLICNASLRMPRITCVRATLPGPTHSALNGGQYLSGNRAVLHALHLRHHPCIRKHTGHSERTASCIMTKTLLHPNDIRQYVEEWTLQLTEHQIWSHSSSMREFIQNIWNQICCYQNDLLVLFALWLEAVPIVVDKASDTQTTQSQPTVNTIAF